MIDEPSKSTVLTEKDRLCKQRDVVAKQIRLAKATISGNYHYPMLNDLLGSVMEKIKEIEENGQ